MSGKILIASDHAGLALKNYLIQNIVELDYTVEDLGCHENVSCDYPVFAKSLCSKIQDREADCGVLICGTGIGMSMTANRFEGIRAALCTTEFHAKMSRAHNDSNVLVLGGRITGDELAREILKTWLITPFEGGRHQRRVELIEK